jgi:CubicO group peptidase (beta-lactamase class C family)
MLLLNTRTAFRSLVLFLSAALISLTIVESVSAQTVEQKLDEYLKAAEYVIHFTGSVLVAENGKVLFSKGYGMADIDDSIPNTPTTPFLIGSVTKQFTATLIMQLVAERKLAIEDPITKYLTDYPKATGDKVTIRHLLNHTSGVPSYTDNRAMMLRILETGATPQEIVASFEDLPLLFEPGTAFRYSNSGYFLLGLIIEKVTGQPYDQYLQARILKPIGMNNTGYMNYDVEMLATGYRADSNKVHLANKPHPSLPYAAGGLYSTVGDLFLWDQALYGEKLLSQEMLKQMWTPALDGYGFGWVIDSLYGHKRIWHNGQIDGFVSNIQRFVDDSIGIVILSNNESMPEGQIAASLSAIILDQPYSLPVRKTPASIDPTFLADYVGAYQIGPDTYRLITRQGDSLFSQRTGGARRLIYSESKDRFFFDYENSITLDFIRDSSDNVVEHRITQNGIATSATKLFGPLTDSLLEAAATESVRAVAFDALVGSYQLAPGFVLEVRRRGTQFFCQATGQEENEIFARSQTEYFLNAVDAQLTFVKDQTGTITGLVLHQDGRDMPAVKIK